MLLFWFEHHHHRWSGKLYLVSRYVPAPSSSNLGFRYYRIARNMFIDLCLHNDDVPMSENEQNRATRDGMAKLRSVRCVSVLYKVVHPLTHDA